MPNNPYQFLSFDTTSASTDGYVASSGQYWTRREYVYEDSLPVRQELPCEFCGNKSKLRDVRGNCVACGAVRDE
jgi:hypothetical protein